MDSIITIIISPSYGIFEPSKSLERKLKSFGYENLDSIEARTDERVISFIRSHMEKSSNQFPFAFLGKEKHQYLSLVDIDISHPWTIINSDGSERIHYLNYIVLDAEINYCKPI
ncbi:hypothetical protein ACFVS2_21370 [Brevibacillus sp. NPDC058079]|uniref:hypothetical protein n=1 Tax=Brevibacillus sp. NPDC058079 TaxID=3346330 RepID=UPI0036E6A4A9